jgi:hypothetical protein
LPCLAHEVELLVACLESLTGAFPLIAHPQLPRGLSRGPAAAAAPQ